MVEQLTLEEHLESTASISDKISNPSFNIGYVALDIARETNRNVTTASYWKLEAILAKAKLEITLRETYSRNDAKRILKSIHKIIESFELMPSGLVLSDEKLQKIMSRTNERIKNLQRYDKNDALKIFREVLEDEESRPEINLDNLFVNSGFTSKTLSCLGYSTILLSTAEHVGLPLEGILVPGHIFVKWNGFEKPLYWDPESLVQKEDPSEQDYIEKFNIHRNLIEQGLVLKGLTREQFFSAVYINKAIFRMRQDNVDEALIELALSEKLNPDYFGTYGLKASVHAKNGNFKAARLNVEKALEINPNFTEGYLLRSILHIADEHYQLALEDLNKGINICYKSQYIFDRRDCATLLQQKLIIQRMIQDDDGFKKTVQALMAISMVPGYAPASF